MSEFRQIQTGDTQAVTSSELVRHFGVWQDRAQQAPVYIHHRGRPRLVLASIELMSRLCAPRAGEVGDQGALAAVLDALDALVVLVNRDCRVAALGRRAARYFTVAPGAPAAALSGAVTARLLETALLRVLDTGADETLDIAGPHGQRRLTLDLAAGAGGVVVIARDASAADELSDLRAIGQAGDAALAATATIGLRGYLEGDAPLLAAMSGVTQEALATVRFVTLFDTRSRVMLGDAIEAVIADATPCSIAATLSVNRSEPKPVAVGLAPIRRSGATTGLRTAIVETGTPHDGRSTANPA